MRNKQQNSILVGWLMEDFEEEEKNEDQDDGHSSCSLDYPQSLFDSYYKKFHSQAGLATVDCRLQEKEKQEEEQKEESDGDDGPGVVFSPKLDWDQDQNQDQDQDQDKDQDQGDRHAS